jgi:hypothetical protein
MVIASWLLRVQHVSCVGVCCHSSTECTIQTLTATSLHPNDSLLFPTGYGIGFFHDQSGVAFSSDNILDLIPVDTTAALLIAAASSAAANGPLPSGKARVYHAASAASNPRSIVAHLSLLRDFWVANPPPFCLPFTRCDSAPQSHCDGLNCVESPLTVLWCRFKQDVRASGGQQIRLWC